MEKFSWPANQKQTFFFSPRTFWRPKFMLFEIVISSKVYCTGHFTAGGGPAIG
jgi:hypothetical protein